MALDSRANSRRTTWLAALAIALAALIVYCNSFTGDLIFDDIPWIVINPTIHKLWPLSEVLFPSNKDFASGRPVLNLTIAINYAFAGTDVRSYHATNLLIHILAALTLFGVARRTLAMPVLKDRFAAAATPLALAIALLWVVHPLQTAAVSYVIQRTEALVCLFYLVTLYCVIRAASSPRPLRWYLAAITACLLGMGTKEVMATAPFVVLLYDRTFLAGSFANALRRRWGLYAAMASTWGVIAWCFISSDFHSGSTGFTGTGFTALTYAKTQPGVIVHYLRLAFWPARQCLDYSWPAAESVGAILPPALVVAALVLLTIWALVKNPPLGFLGAWFFAILAPTSSFVPIRDAAFEHRMYLPLAAIVALVVVGGYVFWTWVLSWQRTAEGDTPARRWLWPLVLLAMAIVALGWLTLRRNAVFSSGEAIWQEVVDQCPDHARAHNNLAVQLLDNGKLAAAIEHCQIALKLTPGYGDAEGNLGLALARQGKFKEAIACYRKALEFVPTHQLTLVNLADELATNPDASLRNGAEAVVLAKKAVAQLGKSGDPDPATLGTLAAAYAEAGQFPQAVETADHARDLATEQRQDALANELGERIKLYKAGKPYRKPVK